MATGRSGSLGFASKSARSCISLAASHHSLASPVENFVHASIPPTLSVPGSCSFVRILFRSRACVRTNTRRFFSSQKGERREARNLPGFGKILPFQPNPPFINSKPLRPADSYPARSNSALSSSGWCYGGRDRAVSCPIWSPDDRIRSGAAAAPNWNHILPGIPSLPPLFDLISALAADFPPYCHFRLAPPDHWMIPIDSGPKPPNFRPEDRPAPAAILGLGGARRSACCGGGSMAGEKSPRAFSMEELPGHLIGEVLTSGRLAAGDLARLELTCRALRPLAEHAASRLCAARTVFAVLGPADRGELLARCGGSWKKVLRFLQSVEQSSDTVETSSGNMQVATGRYHTLLVHDSSVYSCGSSLCGVLGHGPDTTQCVAFTRVSFPSLARVVNISAFHNHAAFVTESGEVFTCGDNSSSCCGHGDVGRTIFRPTQIEALKGIACKQVATGLSYTVILTRNGQVYTFGSNTHGQLGHGDTIDRPAPKIVELFEGSSPVVQVAAGASYTFAVTDDGTVHSFGSCTNFCLGHGDQHNELLPRAIQSFKKRNIHVVRVSAGDEHAVALDALGHVYTWGRGYCGALGHGDENDKTSPELIGSLKGQVAVQVCARKRKTFVLTDEGSVIAFGWMGFGSLGFHDRGSSEKVMQPRVLDSLRGHYVSQISTGLYHTVAVTNKGIVFGFGDNERAQLGHEYIRGCLKPTEIMFHKSSIEDIAIAAPIG